MGSKLQSSFLVKNSLSSVVCGDIRNIMKRLSDSNDDIVLRDLLEYIGHGKDGSILLLQTCLDFMNLRNGDSHDMHPKPELLAETFHHLLVQENFSTVLNEVLSRVEISEGFLSELSETFQLSVSEKVRFGLAMEDSENLNIQAHGQKFCLHQIENFIEKLSGLESVEEVQKILLFLQRSKNSVKDVDSFLQMLSVDLKAGTVHVLLPLLSNGIRDTRFFSGDGETEFDSLLEEMERKASVPDIMMELGYGCTSGISYCKEILSLFVPLTEATISRILSTVVRTYTGLEDSQSLHSTYLSALGINSNDSTSSSSWNIDVLLTSIRELAPTIDWVLIMENLDHEGFFIPSEDSFVFFMSCYCRACKDPFPLHSVCGSVWENIRGQLSFLRYAVSSPPEMFTFAHSFRQLSETDLQSMHERTIKQSNMAWSSLDLLEVLCLAAEKGHAGAVRAMLEFPLRHFPGILLLGLAKINTAYNLLQNEVFSTVLPIIVVKDEAASIIRQIWLCNSKLISFGFANIMTTDPDFMVKIVDICQELNILTTLLEIIPYGFAIRLSVLGHRKDCIDLEKWLDTYICNYGDAFFEECLKFLKGLLFDPSNDLSGNPKGYSNLTSIFMRVLHSNSENVISSHLHEELRALHLPGTSLPDNSSPREIGVSDPQASDAYPSDVEAEANNYFQQIFSGQLTIEAMIQMLAAFKVSSNEREQSIYQCMIQNLFEEYRFLPKYPEKQLKISGTLLGCLIKHKLVTHLYLGVALRGVLDALRKPVDSKLFVYGTKALEQFLDRLTEWPQYCNHILQISHLRSAHPDLLTVIERALVSISVQPDLSLSNVADQPNISTSAPVENLEILGTKAPLPAQISTPPYSQQNIQTVLTEKLKVVTTSTVHSKLFLPSVESTGNLKNSPAQLSSGVLPSNRGSASARFGSALNIETLVSAAERRESQLEIPSTEVQDKILFMINNISVSNIETKTKEFNEILIDQYYPWFSQYMVMKRASIEPNFHDLYLKFLDKVNSKILNKEIVKFAYENCKVLLGSDLIKSSSEERSLLKNLGSWLGKFTIGRNQVLRAQEIDPKSLIIEAYEKGLMIAMIPFTSKILEPCHHSLAYRPPNPWTMGILGLLVEIYALPNLKMNLRFDIEVLFKNLCVDMKDVKPTSLLKDRVREVEGNPDFSTKDVGMAHSQIVSEISSGIISTLNQGELQSDMVSPSRPPSGHLNVVQQYPSSIHLSSGPLVEEEKLTSLTVSARILPGQVLSQVSLSPSSYSAGQLPTVIPNIGNHVILNQKLSSLGLHYFQRVVPGAIERALKEVTLPVVQRSVTIAMQTAKELVMKDYAMEADETRIYNAAHLMVASLAGSLAHVTCKEPLRTSISSQLRSSFQGLNIASDLLEQAVPLVMNDNLDLGCAAIEQSAMEKAVHSIDGEIAQLLTLRRKHREGVGPSYFEASMYTQGPMGMVPEALRPRPGHLSHSQQRVYEDFVRFPWQNQPGQSSNMVSGPAATSLGSVSSAMSRGFFPSSVRPNNAALSSGVVAVGQNTVTQSTDITSFESESGSQLLSSRVGQGGGSNVGKLNPSVSSVSIPDTAETVKINMKELASNLMISPSAVPEQLSAITDMMLSTGDVLEEYQNIMLKLETLILKDAGDVEIQAVISQIPEAILKCVSRDEAALAVAQKVFKSLYDSPSDRNLVNVQLVLLAAIRDVCKLVVKEVTSWVIYSDEERKFNTNIIVGLIRKDLLNLAEYNVHMAKLMDGGRNKAATNFVISLVELLLLQESRVTLTELPNLVDALSKIAARPGSPESLQHLIEAAKNPNLLSSGHDDKHTRHPKKRVSDRSFADDDGGDDVDDDDDDDDDPLGEISVLDLAGFREQVSSLFVEWYQMYEIQNAGEAACSHFILQLQQAGFLNGDDVTDRFFRFLTELSVAHCVSAEGSSQIATFAPVDVYAKLVVQTLKFTETGPSRLTLFAKILSETIRVIQRDTEDNRGSFNPRPYFRLFIDWLFDLVCTDAIFDGAGFQVLVLFANTFHTLQPLKIPAFSFAWLELVSHRTFMPKLLLMTPPKGWVHVQRLLVDLFRFMEPYLRNAELGRPIEFLYRGTLRVLLVLLHDFPEFLCDYHFSFCDVIPSSCIQMRNVILSAFPRNMRLPDPSTPNLKIDLLPEIAHSPRIFSDVDAALRAKQQMKSDLDEYIRTRIPPPAFLPDLKAKLILPPSDAAHAGTRYNVPLINSLVLYVGVQTVVQMPAVGGHSGPMEVYLMGGPAVDIFQTLMVELDTEGRYLFLNAIANQLRYPNIHTHLFSFTLLYLFVEAHQEVIQEQITRVLLERLIVNRPHPWGLLITFMELIKNTRYNFWSRSFTTCAPEIEKLFDSVSRSCGGPKAVDDSAGLPDMR